MKFHLKLDESGELQKGTLFHVSIPFDFELPESGGRTAGGVGDAWGEGDYADVITKTTWLHTCRTYPEHYPDQLYNEITVDVFHAKHLFELIRTDDQAIICRQALHDRLKKLTLKGVNLAPAKLIGENRRKLPVFAVYGRAVPRRLETVVDHPNVCFKCGNGPVYCESCGSMMARCRKCGCRSAVAPSIDAEAVVAGKKQLFFDPNLSEQGGMIVEGRLWDGSDLMRARHGWIMTKRLLNFFERSHFGLLHVWDVRLCTDYMTEEQQGWIKRAETLFD